MDNEMKLPVDGQRLREFTGILQKYKAGKHSVERRTIAAENWWKLRKYCPGRRGTGRRPPCSARSSR